MCRSFIPITYLRDNLAKFAVATTELKIRKTIMRVFGSIICFKSNLIRSNRLTLQEIVEGFPDDLHVKVHEIVLKMADEYVLTRICEGNTVYYIINPNKNDIVKNILSANLITVQPIEELISKSYVKEFERDGAKDSKGNISKYVYYRDSNEPYHFCVFIQTSIHDKPEKKDLGSLTQNDSILSQVWYAIDKKLQKDTFRKVQLNSLISNPNITQNRQPLKAAIDVLEYLGYIKRTDNRKGKSQEYQKTDKQPPDIGLDKFFDNTQ